VFRKIPGGVVPNNGGVNSRTRITQNFAKTRRAMTQEKGTIISRLGKETCPTQLRQGPFWGERASREGKRVNKVEARRRERGGFLSGSGCIKKDIYY